jgi:hypothetical protein
MKRVLARLVLALPKEARALRLSRWVFVGCCVMALAPAAVAVAMTRHHSSGTTDFGPYTQIQSDTTTCGTVWTKPATRSQTFHVYPRSADGSYIVDVESQASWRTLAGQSVGACNNGQPDDGSTVAADIALRFTQSVQVVVRDGTLDTSANCGGPCTVATFVPLAFGPTATFEFLGFSLRETSKCNGSWIAVDSPKTFIEYDAGDISGPKREC